MELSLLIQSFPMVPRVCKGRGALWFGKSQHVTQQNKQTTFVNNRIVIELICIVFVSFLHPNMPFVCYTMTMFNKHKIYEGCKSVTCELAY